MQTSPTRGFSQEWEQRYRDNTHLGVWPWSDLVSYVMRYAKPAGKRVLELGCGAGANIPFFAQQVADYHAIEGSDTIVHRLWEKFPQYRETIKVGDFTQQIPFDGMFDLIVDRGSLTCNRTDDIRNALRFVYERLKPDGKFIGIDWFSTQHSDYGKAELLDPYTSANLSEGHLANTGIIHFSDRAHLEDLFSDFRLEVLEHKTVKRELPEDGFVLATWHLVVSKR